MAQGWYRINDRNIAVEAFYKDPSLYFHPDLIWIPVEDSLVALGDVYEPETETWRAALASDIYPDVENYREVMNENLANKSETENETAELNPVQGVVLSQSQKKAKDKQRDAKAKQKNNKLTDSEDYLIQHQQEIYTVELTLATRITEATTHEELDAIVIDDAPWPAWIPPEPDKPE